MRLGKELNDPADPEVLVVVDERQANVFGANGGRAGQLVAEGQVNPAVQPLADLKHTFVLVKYICFVFSFLSFYTKKVL
jgi:hypothetical protein